MPGGKSHKKSQKGRTREFSSIEEMRRNMRNNSDSDDADAPNDDNAGVSGAPKPTQNVANAEDSGTDTDTDDEQETKVIKKKGVGDLIEICNPNRLQRMTGNEINLTFKPESLDKREKPEGKPGSIDTERVRADLARLAIVRQQRQDAALKREVEANKREVEMAEKAEKNFFKNK